jgi:hypothetical protein
MPCPVMGWRATYHHCGLFPTVYSTEPRCPQCIARRGCGMLQEADIPVLICEVVVVFSPKSSRQEIFGDVGRNRLNGLQSWHLFVDGLYKHLPSIPTCQHTVYSDNHILLGKTTFMGVVKPHCNYGFLTPSDRLTATALF